jgi:DNA-binding NarL/FixJ family response regulator
LFLILEGLQNQEIASALGLSLRSVRARISELLARFNVKRRGELVSHAVKLGLIVPNERFPDLRAKTAFNGR